jgi:hypothetical protein
MARHSKHYFSIASEGLTELFTGIILETLDNLLQGVLRLHYYTTTFMFRRVRQIKEIDNSRVFV